jgi:hypothetical protein
MEKIFSFDNIHQVRISTRDTKRKYLICVEVNQFGRIVSNAQIPFGVQGVRDGFFEEFSSQEAQQFLPQDKILRRVGDRFFVGETPLEQVENPHQYLPLLPDTIDFFN